MSFRKIGLSVIIVVALAAVVWLTIHRQTKAESEHLSKARNSDPAAQTELAEKYLQGSGVPKNEAIAAELFQSAADRGYPAAERDLGMMYMSGMGFAKDESKGEALVRRAADHNDSFAQFLIGNKYLNEKNEAVAVEWYRKAAENGNAAAQLQIGMMYSQGTGVPKNQVEAANWFTKAAEQGYADAQNTIGQFYLMGIGVRRDETQAADWLRKSASQGYVPAQELLGRIYKNSPINRSYSDAYFWLNVAVLNTDVSKLNKDERERFQEDKQLLDDLKSKLGSEAQAIVDRARSWAKEHPAVLAQREMENGRSPLV